MLGFEEAELSAGIFPSLTITHRTSFSLHHRPPCRVACMGQGHSGEYHAEASR
jgi:hypothetical protein